jgi:fumarate hydratase subunit alpha
MEEGNLREIWHQDVKDAVAQLCMEANFDLGEDVLEAIELARGEEPSPLGKQILGQLLENAEIARSECVPLCQDCGMAVVFLEMGQDVRVTGGGLENSVVEGVARGYREGFLRKSVVDCPIGDRRNTGDNTPPVIHSRIVPGERLRIVVAPKGAGSENMSAMAMLKPADGEEGIARFVVETVDRAGGKPCPPVIVGVGIGGTMEKAALLAKSSLLRRVGESSEDAGVAALERDILKRVNDLGIGPMAFGGRTTALAVHAETFPCHMATLPVAVNLQCHSARHKEVVL